MNAAKAPMVEGRVSLALPPVEERLGVHAVFFTVPRPEVVYVKLLIESYEGIGIARSMEPNFERGIALLVLLAVPDFAALTAGVLAELTQAGIVTIVEPTAEMRDELARMLLD